MKFQVPDFPVSPDLAAVAGNSIARLEASPGGREYAANPVLQHAFYCSEFVAAAIDAEPSLAAGLLADGALAAPFSAERLQGFLHEYPHTPAEADFMRALRLFRRRELLRIALRDLCGWAELEETLGALSGLADFCIRQAWENAYRVLCEKHGTPIAEDGTELSLIVLALGKLGGGELNFSSDIDVIFAYAEPGQTRAANALQREIDAQDFFIRQAQLIVKYLHEVSSDGFVFRVDTRLRPFGDSGALVVSFDFMENYYQNQGRNWERYALIKARPVCGAEDQARRLMQLLQPFIYRRYLDYGAFAALREMKAMIMREVERKGLRDNVKLGAGGIREVEFIAQAFQLIRGGREPEFRRRELLPVLRLLGERKLLDMETVEHLLSAYRFLRNTENRLQMIADQQIHRLPKTPLERERLIRAMGFGDWDSFYAVLDEHRVRVTASFAEIFHAAPEEQPAMQEQSAYLADFLEDRLPEKQALAVLAKFGFSNGDQVLDALRKFRGSHQVRQMGSESRQRLRRLLEPLFMEVAQTQNIEQTLERVLNVLQSIVQRSVYMALLCEYPNALAQLVRLCSSSGWIADYLQAQPILLDSLLDARFLYRLPDREELGAQLRDLMQGLSGEDFEQQLNALRHFKHEQVLRVAAMDVNGDLPLMKVSDQLTWLAEVILQQVHEMARQEMLRKYGHPRCGSATDGYEPELAVVAYGKLGGIELGYSSDLDVVFLHNSSGDGGQTRGERPVANEIFFARYGQRMIQILSTQMPGGVLYEVDPRLRPDGAAGPLVGSFHGYVAYQRQRAWVWEHQALVRARVIVGSAEFVAEFTRLRDEILRQPRDLEKLRTEVRDMRNRMKAELARGTRDAFDLKQDRGGITDIEFIVQYGVLAWAGNHPELTRYTDNIRILEQFERFSLLPPNEAQLLTAAYRHLRGKVHRLALQGSQALLEDSASSREYIDAVTQIWNRLMEAEAPDR